MLDHSLLFKSFPRMTSLEDFPCEYTGSSDAKFESWEDSSVTNQKKKKREFEVCQGKRPKPILRWNLMKVQVARAEVQEQKRLSISVKLFYRFCIGNTITPIDSYNLTRCSSTNS